MTTGEGLVRKGKSYRTTEGDMSKPSRRPNREKIKEQKRKKKKAERGLRESQKLEGLSSESNPSISNSKSEYQSVGEEREARSEAVIEQVMVFRSKLPILLSRLSQIDDPRNPKKIKHKSKMPEGC